MYNGSPESSCNETSNQVLLNYIAAVANSSPERSLPENCGTPTNPRVEQQDQLNGSDVTKEIGTIHAGSGQTTEGAVTQEENLAPGSECVAKSAVNETTDAKPACKLDSQERPAPVFEYEALSPAEPASEQDCDESMESATQTLLNMLDANSSNTLVQESASTETTGEPTSEPSQSQSQSVSDENPSGPRRSKRATRPVLNFGGLLDGTSQAVHQALANSFGQGTSTSGSAGSRAENATRNRDVASPRRRRQRTPNETFPCETCGKVFYSFSNLRQHSLVHNDDKKYACSVCGKMFRFLPNLYDHKTIHEENADVHECPICEKKCRLKGNLKKHFRVHYKTDTDLEVAWQMFSKNTDSRSPKKEGSSSVAAQENEDLEESTVEQNKEESTVERAFLQNVPKLPTVSQPSTSRKRKRPPSRAPEASRAQDQSLNGDLEVKEETAIELTSNQAPETSYELRKRPRRSGATTLTANGHDNAGGTPPPFSDAYASAVVRDFLERAPRLNREVAHTESSPPPALSPQDATGSAVLQGVKEEEDESAADSTPTMSQDEPEDNSRNRTHLNGHNNLSDEGQFAGSSQVLLHSPTRVREGGSASKELLVQLSVARAQIHELKQTIGQKDELIEKERLRREKLVADHKWELAKKDLELASLRRQLVATQDGASTSSGVTDAERLLEMEKELQARDALIARLMMSNNSL